MERGSVLIDVLFAISVFAMGVIGFSSASVHVNALRRSCDEREIADAAVHREIGLLRAMDYSQVMGRNNMPFSNPVDVDCDSRVDPSMISVVEEEPGILSVQLTLTWGPGPVFRRVSQRVLITNRRNLGDS
jgi:hypothetical protein